MKFIEEMAERMDEELDGAEEYAEGAHAYKDEHPMLAKHMHDMAMDELRHAHYINDEACAYIKEHHDREELRHVWDFVKRHSDRRIERINNMLDKFRG